MLRPVLRKSSTNCAVESGSPRSTDNMSSSLTIPFSSLLATSTRLAGTITRAPELDKALEVSRPIPEYPPVTIAIFPDKSISFRTSWGSLFAPKPELIGFCNSEIISSPFLYKTNYTA